MIYLLCALLAGLSWAIWFILQWHILFPVITTAVLGLIALVLFIFKTIRAKRAAAALERAIAEQGRQQAMNANPQARAEIQALQKQIQDGISAIKSSKLGGKKRGAGALYSLPWYAIIGPPGAGKTTALKHSGLQFPYADSSIKGVGGTRNCDWWFTNEAILLDTAGRYATEQADQQEWLAFLSMLLKYRGSKPLNGLIVAVSVPDLLDSNEQQLESMGKKLRARIDEVMTKLRMVLPVYILVTKCDLIAGFVEFFGDLRKSERAQAWGATLLLKENKSDPQAVFAREFDTLVSSIHARAMKRMARERDRAAKERIYQFPLEFAGIRRNLSELLHTVFMVNAFQGTPTFRGFYFTSGTQEGKPLERVLQKMGQAMGIQSPQMAQMQYQPSVESKSYFLHDVFTNIVFPDAEVAARSASEIRRQRFVRLGVSGVALALAVVLAIPSSCSFYKNRQLLKDSERIAMVASKINWDDNEPVSQKLPVLKPVFDRLRELDKHMADSPPVEMRWLMYQGDQVYRPLIRVFVANMQRGFVKSCEYDLAKRLNKSKGKEFYLEERTLLKQYLMLSDVENLEVDWATGQYTNQWVKLQEGTSDVASVDLRKSMQPMIKYYFELIKPDGGKAKAAPIELDKKIINKAREVLLDVPVRDRYYAMFVDRLNYEKYDEDGDDSRANRMFPPITLKDMFADRPEVLKWISSGLFEKEKKWYKVDGPYTDKGHYWVLHNIQAGEALLAREQWVVPLTDEERGDKVVGHLAKLVDDYENRYIDAWKGFLSDLQVKTPATIKEAMELYKVLKQAEYPYLRILRSLEDHTQWKKSKAIQNEGATNIINRKLNARLTQKMKGIRFNVDINKIGGKLSKIPGQFKRTISFGVPQDKEPLKETPLAQFIEMLGELKEKMDQALEDQPEAKPNVVALDLQNAVKRTEAMVQPLDDTARLSLLPLLQYPLNVGGGIQIDASLRAREILAK